MIFIYYCIFLNIGNIHINSYIIIEDSLLSCAYFNILPTSLCITIYNCLIECIFYRILIIEIICNT